MNRLLVHRDERGIALVMAMLILLVMTLLGLVLMAGVSLNRSLAGNDQRMRETLNLAEAGVGEALARIRNQETLMDGTDPDDVCQVFNTVAGSVPALGADSVGLATGQPVGQFLEYTTPARGPDVLTIAWKKDPTGTLVMRYDPASTPKVNTASGFPIYTVTSTGRVGNARRTVVAELIQKPVWVSMKGALTADQGVKLTGNAVVCGFNHNSNTPVADGEKGRGTAPDCMDDETVGTNLAGIWTSSVVDQGGNAGPWGTPGRLENQTGFYAGPWEACQMSQAEFYAWLGGPRVTPTSMNGINYIDNNTVTQDKSASLALHDVEGEGLLYVDGNLSLNSGFVYRGMIYVEGDLEINGHAWVLGGVIVKGNGQVKANGGMTVLYSSEAITQALAKFGGQFVTLSWREK